jgi:hypothetical protein
MKIRSPFLSFVWIMTFNLWNFKGPSFGLIKEFDCDSIKVYWNNNLLHKMSNLLKYYQLNNVVNHFNPLHNYNNNAMMYI